MRHLIAWLFVFLCSSSWNTLLADEDYEENMDYLLHEVGGHRQGIVVWDENGVSLRIHTSCYFKAPNGNYYYRWRNDNVIFSYPKGILNPVDDDFCNPKDREPLDYGYRYDDGKMYVYNFKTEEESVAYDFTLEPGEQMMTPDGTTWEVVSRRTEVFESLFANQTDYKNEHVVLSVRSSDGKLTDEWVEYIGSMHYPMQYWGRTDVQVTRTAFFNFTDAEDKLVYFPFSEDPIYGHYIEVDPSPYAVFGGDWGSKNCSVSADGDSLTITINRYHFFTRYYCYTYRHDNTFDIHSFELGPLLDDGDSGSPSLNFSFPSLPSADHYNVVFNGETYSTSIDTPRESNHPPLPDIYDIQGRKMPDGVPIGILIKDGKKYVK